VLRLKCQNHAGCKHEPDSSTAKSANGYGELEVLEGGRNAADALMFATCFEIVGLAKANWLTGGSARALAKLDSHTFRCYATVASRASLATDQNVLVILVHHHAHGPVASSGQVRDC
jgi:hypothetical protein